MLNAGLTTPYAIAAELMRSSGPGSHLDRGMSFRFKVHLDHVDTGDWSACSGLKVDFKPEQLRSGGRYSSARWMPGEVSYPRLVLRRAINAKGSEKVQKWLKDNAWKWMRDSFDVEDAGGSASIYLYDAYDHPVMKWTLKGVRPAAWSGPDLDAATGKVALETLELVHRGFLIDVLKTDPKTGSGSRKFHGEDEEAKLANLTITGAEGAKPAGTVTFGSTPDKVVVTFAARGSTGFVPDAQEGGPLVASSTRAGVRTYKISGLNLFPQSKSSVKQQADLLLQWADKQEAKAAAPRKKTKVKVTWGEFLTNPAGPAQPLMRIAEVGITYTRFLADGTPIRAQVTTLNLEELPPEGKTGAGNPTSAGIAGRRTHRLTLGESLASLSKEYYGNGLRWREIAEANGIDDPARLPPGTLLYLPALAELTGRQDG